MTSTEGHMEVRVLGEKQRVGCLTREGSWVYSWRGKWRAFKEAAVTLLLTHIRNTKGGRERNLWLESPNLETRSESHWRQEENPHRQTHRSGANGRNNNSLIGDNRRRAGDGWNQEDQWSRVGHITHFPVSHLSCRLSLLPSSLFFFLSLCILLDTFTDVLLSCFSL